MNLQKARVVACVGFALAIAGCDGSNVGGHTTPRFPDVEPAPDSVDPDSKTETDIGLDGYIHDAPGPLDVPVSPDSFIDVDVAPDPCEAEEKPFGCPCASNADCESGYCVEGYGGGFCSQECIEDCPQGWVCKGTSGFGADLVFLCIPPGENLCETCTIDANCGGDNICVQVDDRLACTMECSAEVSCPGPFECVDDDSGLALCLPMSGSCDCLANDVGIQRPCAVANEFGVCPGQETCDPEQGWYGCDAPTAEAEVCDGMDNDCNGIADDALPETQPCEVTLEDVGTCDGLATCLGPLGWVCMAKTPTVEECDFLDNDCDGQVDEDFKVDGKYATVEHCGTCGQPCEGMYPNATIVCDATLTTPLCVVDACEDGYYQLNDFQCLPEGEALCKPCVDDLPCEGGACIIGEDGLGFCAVSCADEACPDFFVCSEIAGLDLSYCLPASGTCDCGELNDGATRPCSVTNEMGTCFGVETCDALVGWVGCTATEPAEEICDGLDNDCDAVPDDGLTTGAACENENEFGTCLGVEICQGFDGWLCTASEPAPEECNYLDEDCDGQVDEDFLVDGKYATLHHCGQCNKDCEGTLPHATATCDSAAVNPVCKVESCDEGFFQLNEFQCILPPDIQCVECDSDADCYFGVCVPMEIGSHCLYTCGLDDAPCDDGYYCHDIDGFGDVCYPSTQSCECNPANDGATLSCSESNDLGTCFGIRICDGTKGWTPCDAPLPEAEICDGSDNDCDGLVDEDLPLTQPCELTNEFGICEGLAVCLGTVGWACQAMEPGPEICDYLDNDCDGLIDEDFVVFGFYWTLHHCGQCNSDCEGVLPNATALCDVINGTPQCKVEACDEGFFQLNDFQCIDPPDVQCAECVDDGDCYFGVCVPTVQGTFCMNPCTPGAGDCDEEYTCSAVDGFGDVCFPITGSCECNQSNDGATLSCSQTNEFGTCFGVRICDGAVGWSDCDAPLPAVESCDGLDNDCDGLIDEDLPPTQACTQDNEYGVCEGLAICQGQTGWVCQALVPAPETCDYVDNDCNGSVDEDFVAFGKYVDDDHCGVCGNSCVGAIDHALSTCDPTYTVPKCVVAECDEGYVQVSPFQCIPLPDTTCQACATDADCLGGYCIDIDEKSRCAIPCVDDEQCGGETSCQEFPDLGTLCQPDSGSCECNSFTDNSKRTCFVTNGVGTCFGFETCDAAAGWSACDALIPSDELCNGVDDDCDGIIDGGLPPTQACEISNDFGTCQGLATCAGTVGWLCQAQQPTQELCDYQDNNCDGFIDEDFKTDGLYDTLEHCGQCNNDCEGALPNAISVCDVNGGAPTCKVDECLPGYFQLNEFQCILPPDVQCSYCVTDADCYFGKCVTLELGEACLMPCDGGCDAGYHCEDVDGVDLCMPDSGSCACNTETAGSTISCTAANDYGTCFGVRTCEPDTGWSPCNAPEPAEEVCDGLDNDCDSAIDEGLPVTQPCSESNEYGTCEDVEICLGPQGWVCQAPEPGPELCDFSDNDCDGLVDEDFMADGKYVEDDHCGTCNNPCADAIDNATGVCDSQYATPKCVVSECDEGYFQVSPFQCVVPPDTTCQPCLTEQDCFGAPCVEIDGNLRCAIECTDDEDCADGNVCAAFSGSGDLCQPQTGSCECNDFTAGTKRACSKENEYGACLGFETCDPVTGWSVCDALVPSPEVCDGVDNDCDGALDDDLPVTVPCTESNEFGTCDGEATCGGTQGWLCDAMTPAEEVCNGEDDDCDGSEDEDFKNDLGQYAAFEHCGQCHLSCAGGFPHATAYCDDAGTQPMCKVLECDDGFFKYDDFQCIPDSSALCQPCETAEDCQVQGGACVVLIDGSFCFKPCVDDGDCPGGYQCADAGGGDFQCLPETNACTCTGSELDLTRSCEVTWPPDPAPEDPVTTCLGTQFCTVSGWSDCVLPEEACDALDNDCDGIIDEGFLEGGKYVLETDCGQCGNDCSVQTPPNADGYCDIVPLVPVCAAVCFEGFFDVNGLVVDGCECEYMGPVDLPDDDCLDPPDCTEHAKDQNCDGVDGEIDNSIFVSTTGLDTNPGTIDAPMQTIQAGIEAAASTGKRDVYVSEGVYPESISLLPGVGVYGGYSPDYSTRDVLAFNTHIQGQAFSVQMPGAVNAFGIDGDPGSTVLDGFIVEGTNQFGPGTSSYSIYVKDCTDALRLSRNQVIAGNGAGGLMGGVGTNGGGASNGSAGINGSYHSSPVCNEVTPMVLGGPGGAHACNGNDTSGGKGGDSYCPHYEGDPDPGEWGVAGVGGDGGEGGEPGVDGKAHHASCKLCTFPNEGVVEGQDGFDGINGLNGLPGLGCNETAGTVFGGFWTGSSGSAGSAGSAGTGGGGGGAGGGADSDTSKCLDVFGGTGGGGGAGGCTGTGGLGGGPGGASFGIFLSFTDAPASLPEVSDNLTVGGLGGEGGQGGTAGSGGLGGAGGFGGTAGGGDIYCSYGGGQGGDGGIGGHGGGAGGGCGGVSYCIYVDGYVGVDLLDYKSPNNACIIGAPGPGGLGGISLGVVGMNGQSGLCNEANF